MTVEVDHLGEGTPVMKLSVLRVAPVRMDLVGERVAPVKIESSETGQVVTVTILLQPLSWQEVTVTVAVVSWEPGTVVVEGLTVEPAESVVMGPVGSSVMGQVVTVTVSAHLPAVSHLVTVMVAVVRGLLPVLLPVVGTAELVTLLKVTAITDWAKARMPTAERALNCIVGKF